jgi:hypothetical protein
VFAIIRDDLWRFVDFHGALHRIGDDDELNTPPQVEFTLLFDIFEVVARREYLYGYVGGNGGLRTICFG